MPSAGSPPPAPNPQTVIAAQGQANKTALQQSQTANNVSQTTPTGSVDWYTTGVDANGIPQYKVASSLSTPEAIKLAEQQVTGIMGGAAGNRMMADSLPQYSTIPNIFQGADSITNQRMGQMGEQMFPLFRMQQEQLDNQLRNQGIMPTSQNENPADPQSAYTRSMRTLGNTQAQQYGAYLSQVQPQAFDQAVKSYGLPLEVVKQLNALATPNPINPQQTPTYNVQPVQAGNIYNQNYQQQMDAYKQKVANNSAMMNGIMGGVGTALAIPSLGIGPAIGAGLGRIFNQGNGGGGGYGE